MEGTCCLLLQEGLRVTHDAVRVGESTKLLRYRVHRRLITCFEWKIIS